MAPENAERSFWATDGCRNIPEVGLNLSALKEYLPGGWHHLVHLTRLANTLRSMQRNDGSMTDPDISRRLIDQSALALEAAAETCPDEEITGLLRLRARGLRHNDTREAATAQARTTSDRLVVLCGPLVTWPGKSSAYLHSTCIALEDARLTQQARALEKDLEPLRQYYERLLGLEGLQLSEIPSYTVSELVLCGGEANGFPKHFTYFLPEDEGHRKLKPRKTLLFRNIYLERVRCLSLPLLRALCPALPVADEDVSNPQVALTWFRGHDVGHYWRHPAAAFGKLRELGLPRSYALQEALCDVLGYLALHGPWSQPARDDAPMGFYLAEMLRFLGRGYQGIHPDFEASHIVLSYLVKNRFASLDSERGELQLESSHFQKGVTEVAGRLIQAVLGGDVNEARLLLTEYGLAVDPSQSHLAPLIRRAANIGNDIRYTYEG
ncbi:hypothetical protein POL68_07640 [Stigmatella sp. ncwal1]|uniref:Uncharacterized protein n=1 Tax=Stigmatella ashevillensis TaxID=2995309 RepID=A0ABT5D3V2_9BACT|nr:hypothetical protein [Stigmatella ashevillena]MDC0708340.1 hypothetical protein [Stigmatella ashevillena]